MKKPWYRATLDGIAEFDMRLIGAGERVDVREKVAYSQSPQRAKDLLCESLRKRVAGAQECVRNANALDDDRSDKRSIVARATRRLDDACDDRDAAEALRVPK